MYSHHEEVTGPVAAPVDAVFALLDDHKRLGSHMSKRSWMMGGGKMDTILDAAHGRAVGSRISVRGRVFGLMLWLDERVTERIPPHKKTWETEGEPRLLIIGRYRMGFELAAGSATSTRVWIDYDLTESRWTHWLGVLLSGWYARWCVTRMLGDAQRAFSEGRQASPDRQLA